MLRSSGLLQGLVTQRVYIIVHPTPAWASLSAFHSLVINHGWDMKHAPCNHVIRRPKHPASFALKVWLRTLTDACQIRLAGWYTRPPFSAPSPPHPPGCHNRQILTPSATTGIYF